MSLWNRKILQLTPFWLTFVLLTSWLPGAENQLSITCLGPDGQPLGGVKVLAQNLSEGGKDDEKTNSSGVALFGKLKDGVYRILAREKGFGPAFHEFVILKGGSQKSFTLHFQQGNYEEKLYFEDTNLSQNYDQLFQSAVQSIQSGQLDQAEASLVKALKIIPSDPGAQYYLGFTRVRQSNWEGAKEALEVAIESTDARMALDKGRQADELAQVRSEAEKLLGRLPLLQLYDEGNSALSERRFAEAIEKFEKFIKTYPNDANADTYYNLALAYTHAENYDEATEWIQKALSSKPNEAAFNTLKRQIEQRKEQAFLEQASVRVKEADQMLKQEQWEAARAKYEEALAIVTSSGDQANQATIWKQIAVTYEGVGDHAQAEKAYIQANSLAPDDKKADYRALLAQFYDRTKNYEALLDLYADSGSGGGSASSLFQQGQQLSRQGKQLLAQRFYEKAVELDPQFAEGYYELGMVYFYDRKDSAQAEKALRKYKEIGKDKDHLGNTEGVLAVIESQKKKP